MASEKNLNAVFTDIANAIREKKGTTEQFQPINMADEIANLPSGGETVELSVTQNGIYTPNEGTAYSKVSVSVPQTAESGTMKAFLDTTKSCYYLFYNYKGTSVESLISYSDTSSVTNMSNMFTSCPNLTTIPLLDTSKAIYMSYMFSSCYKLITIPQFDTSNVNNMNNMFAACSDLETIPQLDTSRVTNMAAMFTNCPSLTAIPLLDTSNVTDMNNMFYDNRSLTTIPQLNTSRVTNMKNMFYGCTRLTTIPLLDTSSVTNIESIFYNCKSLTTVPQLDVSNITSLYAIFEKCSSLKSVLMYGMKVSFSISSSTQFEESDLVTILNNLATVTSTKTLTMGSTNLAKLTDEEKAIATNKGWTLK